VEIRVDLHEKEGKLIESGTVVIDESGIAVNAESGAQLGRTPPEQYIDIGFPGFFAGRAYLELPVSDDKTLYLKMSKEDLARTRREVDVTIGRRFRNLLEPKLAYHKKIMYAGLGIFIVGLAISIAGLLLIEESGWGVVFYSLPIAGIAMVCNSRSQSKRIRSILDDVR